MSCSYSSQTSDEPLYGSASSCDMEFYYALPKAEWNKDQVLFSESLPEVLREWYFAEIKAGKRWSFRCYEDEELDEGEYCVRIYPSGKILKTSDLTIFMDELKKFVSDPESSIAESISEEELYICTDGPHDQCCGEFGFQVFEKAKKLAYESLNTYQVSHLGGHKFAATMKYYPSNVMYGRVNKDNISGVLKAIEEDYIYADCYRGRGIYNLEQTIAEYVSVKNNFGSLEEVEVETISDTVKNIIISCRKEGILLNHSFRIERRFFEVFGSCKDEEKKMVPRWVVK
ncbi:MAG: sucrase ferredoxin [Candidatus Gracilibacteria bacterium]